MGDAAGLLPINCASPNETMTSGAIGAEHFYKLEDVLFTQYFTDAATPSTMPGGGRRRRSAGPAATAV